MRASGVAPFAARCRPFDCSAARSASSNDGHERREVLGRQLAVNHPQQWRCGGCWRGFGFVAHSGMFPCFFGGKETRLVRSKRNALVTSARVVDGLITPSM